MEPDSNLPGGMYSGIGSGMLGLEMPLHPQQQQQQQPQNPQPSQNPQSLHLHHHQFVAFGAHGSDPDHHAQAQQSGKQGYPFASKAKTTSPHSDEDEPGDGAGDPKRKMSPWQRMKWTDNMVRLLIMAVYYIGDEVGSEACDPTTKKKAGGLLQKKGKWKSVSRAMMEKGFYVSPQQCEDKFNDLNKRYKRVNEILGKGTACRVVENQSLLETMEISPKMKEEARKLLNSKHLFFREMCAYHNSCGHGAPSTGAASSHSTEMANEPSQAPHQQSQQPLCYHSSDNSQMAVNSCRNGDGLKLMKAGSEEDDDDDNDDSEDDEEEEEEEATEGHQSGAHGQEDDNENEENSSHKRRRGGSASPFMQQLSAEIASMMQDGSKSAWEKKQWMRMKMLQLEEQQVNYQYQAFEMEKQRLKWLKFSSKKERELERVKLENDRRRLETERMLLLVRHKEMELLGQQQQQQQQTSNRRADPSNITG